MTRSNEPETLEAALAELRVVRARRDVWRARAELRATVAARVMVAESAYRFIAECIGSTDTLARELVCPLTCKRSPCRHNARGHMRLVADVIRGLRAVRPPP